MSNGFTVTVEDINDYIFIKTYDWIGTPIDSIMIDHSEALKIRDELTRILCHGNEADETDKR